MKPEILKKAIQLQKEIDELEEMKSYGIVALAKHMLSGKFKKYKCGFFAEMYSIPSCLNQRIQEVIVDEIEARKIMLADLGCEEYGNQ